MIHWLLHILGIDTQQSYFYDLWSGIATQASLFIGGVTLYMRHNCHSPHCPRVGKHVYEGTPYCTRHRPGWPKSNVKEVR